MNLYNNPCHCVCQQPVITFGWLLVLGIGLYIVIGHITLCMDHQPIRISENEDRILQGKRDLVRCV